MAVVWFDAAAPAQPVWFGGLVGDLRAAGHQVVVTCRPGAGTEAVTRRVLGEPAAVVEGHGLSGPVAKVAAIAARAVALARWARRSLGRDAVVVCHNSYAQLLAARRLGLRSLTSMDYEWQPANHLAFRAASRVLLPAAYPTAVARRQGAREGKRRTYPGLKESVALAGGTWDGPPARREHPLAVVRPEAAYAAYARRQRLGDAVVARLLSLGCRVLVLPRGDAADLAGRWDSRVEVATEALDGPALVAGADVVVGAGGTMTREAALLGTPSYSTFAGRTPAVDEALARAGRLTMVRSEDDVSRISVGPRLPPATEEMKATRGAVVAEVLDFVGGGP